MKDPTLSNQGPDLQRMALTAAVVAALTLVACGDRDRGVGGNQQLTAANTTKSATVSGAPSASAPAPNKAPSIPAPPAAPAMAAADRDFVSLAASGDTFEIETSRLALDKTQADAVKTFAQHMIDDHTKISDQLRSIARSAGITDMLSMNATHSADLERLRALSGRDFDREYAAQAGVAAHQEAVALFTQTSRTAADAQLRSYAEQTLPHLREHLQQAQTLAKQVGVPGDRLKLANAAGQATGFVPEASTGGQDTGQRTAPAEKSPSANRPASGSKPGPGG
jgi:putative membrane protein